MTDSGSGEQPDEPDRFNDSDAPTDTVHETSDDSQSTRDDSDTDEDSSAVDSEATTDPGAVDDPTDLQEGVNASASDGSIPESTAAGTKEEKRADSNDVTATSEGEDDTHVSIVDDGIVRWFLKTNDGTVVFVRDLVTSVAVVAIIALILFAVSGVWPPLVAVESGSMEPNMHRGDMIFVVDEQRFTGDDPIEGTGVVTYEVGEENDHSTFGKSGDVIIFQPNGDEYRTPVIHRAHFWVEEGENWVDDRSNDPRIMDQSCESVKSCPAPHPGFVTIGDNNDGYDQIGPPGADTTVVKPEWIEGKAKYRIPWLGYVRLTFDELLTVQPAALWVTGSAALGSVALVGGHRRLH